MLAFLQTLQKDLDNCRHLNLMRLAQLQLQMFAVEQKHQDLISQKHQYQAMMEQVPLPSAKATGWAVKVPHPQPHVPCNHLRPSEAPLLPNSSAEGSDQPSEHRAHSSCHVQDKNAAPHSQLQAGTVVVGLSAQQSRAGSLQPPWVGVSSSTNHRGTCSIPAAWEPRCWACCPPLRPSMGQGLLPRAAGGQQTLPPWEGHQGLWQGPRARSCSPMGLAVSLCQKPVPKPTTIRLPQLSFLQPQSQPLHGQSMAQCTLLGSHTQCCTYPQSQKDTAQTDATSADSCSSSSTSDDLLEEHTEQLEQVRASGTVPACGPPGAGRQCPNVLLPQVTVQAGSKHHRKKWAIKEHQCWAQNMSSTGHRTTKEGRRSQRGTSMSMGPGQVGPGACCSGSSSMELRAATLMCSSSTQGILVQCKGE